MARIYGQCHWLAAERSPRECIRGYDSITRNIQNLPVGILLSSIPALMASSYRPNESTKMLPQIVEKTFPTLVNLGSKAVANPNAPESADFLHLILKTYRVSPRIA